jgi:hypothetical protein
LNVISLEADSSTVPRGKTVAVHVFLDTTATDLRAEQVAIDITGGVPGMVTWETLSVNQQHLNDQQQPDFVFHGQECVTAVNNTAGRLAASLYAGGIHVGTDRKYLGTFILRASRYAQGIFLVHLRVTETGVYNSASQSMPWISAEPVSITVE